MPASGKTTLGTALARHLGRPYIDLDTEIERRSGMSVAAIFETAGEAAFRRLEREILHAVSTRGDVIVGTGGGTPCSEENVSLMLSTGTVVELQAGDETLARRIMEARGSRPHFKNLAPAEVLEHIARLRRLRTPFYSRAHRSVNAALLETPGQVNYTVQQFIKSLPDE